MNSVITDYTGEVEYDFPLGSELFPNVLVEAYNDITKEWRKVDSKIILRIPKKESEDETKIRLSVEEVLMG